MAYPIVLVAYAAKKLYNLYEYYRDNYSADLKEPPLPNDKKQLEEDSIKLACFLRLATLNHQISMDEIFYLRTTIPVYFVNNKRGELIYNNVLDKVRTIKKSLSFYLRYFQKHFNKSQTELEEFIKELICFSYSTDLAVLEKTKELEDAITQLNCSPKIFTTSFQYWLKSQQSFLTSINYGSGFVISAPGLILTAFHVVNRSEMIYVKCGNSLFTAKIVTSDPDLDLSLLTIDESMPSLVFSDSVVKLGQKVTSLSYPKPDELGYSLKATTGTINAVSGYQDHENYYQIDTIVDRGSSGGPLIDEKTGGVVGLLAQQSKTNVKCGYAIKRDVIQKFLKDKVGFIAPLIKTSSDGFNREDLIERAGQSTVQIITFL